MPDYPPEALTAAAERIVARKLATTWTADPDAFRRSIMASALEDAKDTLDAAAVPLGAHVAGKILAHMEAHGPGGGPPRDAWRRHFRIAAQVASRAFLTGEDEKRIVAEALARGDYVHCPSLEDDQGGSTH